MRRPLYAIGDVHGDADRLIKIMTAHDLIDIASGTVRWKKRGVIVIMMGDVTDAKSRINEFGDTAFQGSLSDMWIVEFLKTAAREARKCDSELYALFGNHELMNYRGDFRYASPYHVRDPKSRLKYFKEGDGYDALTSIFLTSVTYNRNHYSHAGIPLGVTDTQNTMLNKRVNAKLLAMDSGAGKSDLEDLVSHRDYFHPADPDRTERVKHLLDTRSIDRMVVGHNYTGGQGIVSDFDGRIVFSDVGISKAFSPAATKLSVQVVYDRGDGDLVALDIDGKERNIPLRAPDRTLGGGSMLSS